jgi:tRNA (guanine-N7-)-methyltransferase
VSLPSDAFRHVASRPHEPLRTFHPRRAPLGREREDALARLWPRYGFSVHDEAHGPMPRTADGMLDVAALFGREAPLVLEIGSGMGETTAAMAAADPDRDYLALEAHLPGVANLLGLVEELSLTNVRVGHGDALDLVRRAIPEGSLDAVHVYFPDPWPKARHHKRRIIRPDVVALIADRLRAGGMLYCATDWAEYAQEMLEVLGAEPWLANRCAGFAHRPPHRPVTKFEARAVRDGREVFDLCFARLS